MEMNTLVSSLLRTIEACKRPEGSIFEIERWVCEEWLTTLFIYILYIYLCKTGFTTYLGEVFMELGL